MDPGRYSVFSILKKALIVGAQAFVEARRAWLKQALKERRDAAKAAASSTSSGASAAATSGSSAKAAGGAGAAKTEVDDDDDEDGEDVEDDDVGEGENGAEEVERWEKELGLMDTAAADLAKWGIMKQVPLPGLLGMMPPSVLKGMMLDMKSINMAALPRSLPAWAGQHAVLAGTYWVAVADDSGYHWSNGQVRDIARAFKDKAVKAAALTWLNARKDMGPDNADWWGELRLFFKQTGRAGSGAETG